MERELRFHVDQSAAQLMKGGLSREAAYRAAERRFGRRELIKDECRNVGRLK